MAILVDEQQSRKSASIIKLAAWFTLLGVIAAGVYYLFFKQQALIEFATPSNFKDVAAIAKITFDPDEVISDPLFLSMKQYVRFLPTTIMGRDNPFLGF